MYRRIWAPRQPPPALPRRARRPSRPPTTLVPSLPPVRLGRVARPMPSSYSRNAEMPIVIVPELSSERRWAKLIRRLTLSRSDRRGAPLVAHGGRKLRLHANPPCCAAVGHCSQDKNG